MIGTITILALIVALAAAVRSTWSPCGLSMLSTVTPLAERARGHRFAVTASWFVLGGILGGATLGLGASLLAALVGAVGIGATTALAMVAVAATIGACSDLRVFGLHLPFHKRQVNEQWLDQFRPWVYGVGFGWQIGTGLCTYIMTAAVYLMIVSAALTANPAIAFAICLAFGFVRGLAVLLGAGITSPEALVAFHRWFDTAGPTVRRVVIVVQFVVAGIAAAMVWNPIVVGVAGFAAVVIAAIVARSAPRHVRPRETVVRVGLGS